MPKQAVSICFDRFHSKEKSYKVKDDYQGPPIDKRHNYGEQHKNLHQGDYSTNTLHLFQSIWRIVTENPARCR